MPKYIEADALIAKLQEKIKIYADCIARRTGPCYFDETHKIVALDNRALAYEEILTALEEAPSFPLEKEAYGPEAAVLNLAAQALRTTPARIRKLCEADREGRAVVLPCKVGQKYYVIDDVFCHDCHNGGRFDSFLRCNRYSCPKAIFEKEVEGYVIDKDGLSNPGSWDYEEFESDHQVYYTRAAAEAALKEGTPE